MRSPQVVILAPVQDVHAVAVEREIISLGYSCLVVDVATLPIEQALTFTFNGGRPELQIGEHCFSPGSLLGVWNRRPGTPRVEKVTPQRDDAEFAARSTTSTLNGALMAVCQNWVNPLSARAVAVHKPFQLAAALHSNFRIPDTVVTSDPSRAMAFAERNGSAETVYKTAVTWNYGLKETRLLKEEDLSSLEKLRSCPAIFQNYIKGDLDLRVTVIGNEIFCGAVHFTLGRSPVDGRLDRVPIARFELNDETKSKLLALHRYLGLTYGAYDFRVMPGGELVFFEVNPDGQFLFVEIATDYPMARAMAELLTQSLQTKQA